MPSPNEEIVKEEVETVEEAPKPFTTEGIIIPEEDQGKKPWEMSWGMDRFAPDPEEVQEAPVADKDKKPWERDWGMTEWLKIVPPAVNAIKSTAKNLAFDTVFDKLIQAESGGKHYDDSGDLLTSSVGAKGITQVMRKTGADPGYGVAPLKNQSEKEYKRFGKDYLKAMLKEYNGDYRKAVAAYNAGPGNVNKAVKIASQKGGDWTQYLPKKSETIPYMKRILGEA